LQEIKEEIEKQTTDRRPRPSLNQLSNPKRDVAADERQTYQLWTAKVY
jgi:hypothetical protein